MCLLKGVQSMCDHSLGLRLNFSPKSTLSHATKGLEGKAWLCNPLQHSVYHRGLLGSNRAHNDLWSVRMAAGWWVTKARRWPQRGLHHPNRYLCLFSPFGTESVSQHLLLLGQESTVTVPNQLRTRSQVCIAHSEHRPWCLTTSQRLTAQCLLAAGTVLYLASHWTSQQPEVSKKWQARKLSQGNIESHFPGYSQLWKWDFSQKTINPGPGN